ncbi:hypothetical protein CPLU01_12119 [Colletotrichum plurivorum]|uniref:Uncharacterized protein n=1 Tax=Colletotrichum plurivorum TaxID=2175906 RepID=A0A8H6N6R2_9PEZI|nr:hypothetical protein CPLU01_12119 [Colletotrichum plurivorum]
MSSPSSGHMATPLLHDAMQDMALRSPPPLAYAESQPLENEDITGNALGANCDYSITYSTKCEDTYQFRDTNIWVGRESKVSVPAPVQKEWTNIKERLLIALEVTKKKMEANDCCEKHARRRHPRELVFTPELRMSGRLETRWSKTVRISSCIWILCGSTWCRDKIRKATKSMDLPVSLFKQRIEVHCGGPTFNAGHALIPRAKLRMDSSSSLVVNEQEGLLLYHHIEGRPEDMNGVCGMVCCTTLVKEDRIIDQHISGIGGVLIREFLNYDFDVFPLAMTTAHGALESLFWPDAESNDVSGDAVKDTCSVCGSDSTSESEEDEEYWEKAFTMNKKARELGSRQLADIDEWILLDHVVGVNFMGKLFQSGDSSGFNAGPADYTILRSEDIRNSCNILRLAPEVTITAHTPNDKLLPGQHLWYLVLIISTKPFFYRAQLK